MTYRRSRALVFAVIAALAISWHMHVGAQSGSPTCGLDMRVLVISADGAEADLPAIREALEYVGTPYDTYIGTEHAGGLTASRLSNGCRGFYQGIILTTNVAVSAAEFQTLATYEQAFGVRQVTWYTWPTPDFGFNWATQASGADVTVRPTVAGAQVFTYLNATPAATPIPIQYSWTYHATALDSSTVPLLTDPEGHALAAVHTYPDGRENLALTFDSNQYLLHSMVLAYGIVNWVTRGMFVGDRHVYMSPQVDDIFLPNVVWTPFTPCLTNVDLTGVETRIKGSDLQAVYNWQTARRQQPITADLRLTMAFNGEGTMGGYGPDTLTPAAQQRQDAFLWVSHTWSHENLDAIGYNNATSEITLNNAKAVELGLTRFSILNIVQPDVSGLNNSNFLRAARDAGIRYLLSDTSKPGQDNPTPNTGRWSALRPELFVIPRRANNLFFNAPGPAAWVAEYNCLYHDYWGRNLTYTELVDIESQTLLTYLLRGELDMWMFHQANLVAYDGVHTVLTDLLDRTIDKYKGFVTLPILSPSMDVIGQRMANRTAWRTSGISATLLPGGTMSLLSPVDVTVPITGLHRPGAESYGGQWITWVSLTANQPLTLPTVLAPSADAGVAQTVASNTGVTLHGSGTDSNTPALLLTYSWAQTSGPSVTLANTSTPTPTFTAPALANGAAPATLTFTLTVSNGVPSVNATSTTTVTVNAPSVLAPTAAVGAAQTVGPAVAVALTGSGQDFNTPLRPLTYAWTQTAGTPSVTLTNANTATPSFTAPTLNNGATPAVLTFQLKVSNGVPALDATATTTVTVNAPAIVAPTAATGAAQTVPSGVPVALAGSGQDVNTPARPLTYAWTQTAGTPSVTLTNANAATANFTAPTLNNGAAPATLTFQLKVSNGVPALDAIATTTVTVNAPPILGPTVSAGAAQLVPSGAPVSLTGTGQDFNTPLRPLTYAWTQTAGTPTVTLTNANTATPAFTAPTLNNGSESAILTFQLKVSNGVVALDATATTTVTVNAPPIVAPTASAGVAQTLASGVPASLAGSGQDHNTPLRPLTYAWTQTAGTPSVTLTNANTATPGFTAPTLNNGANPAVLTFQLKVSNGVPALDATATTTVTVNAPAIVAPTASAGAAQTLASGVPASLAGSGQDHNTPLRPLTFAWTQTAGTPSVTLTNANTATPGFTAPTLNNGAPPAVLTFQLKVSNGVPALDATATTTVTVNAPAIVAPTANAGAAQAVTENSLVTLHGSGADQNTPVRPVTLAWSQLQAPGVPIVTLTNANTATPTFTAPSLLAEDPPANLTFVLTVSNGVPALDATSSTTVSVTPLPVAPPTAAAGDAQTAAAAAAVMLHGTGADPNLPPRPLTYAWTQTAGIPAVTLANANTATPTFTAPTLSNGADPATLTFQLKVSNGVPPLDAVATTTVTITSPAIVAPTGSAGASQSVASGLGVTLAGTGQDHNAPLRPLTYAWTQTSGMPLVSLTNANASSATFTAPMLNNGGDSATLTFQLVVSNGMPALDATSATTVTVTAPPVAAPTATAGIAQTVPSGAAVALSGGGQDHNTPLRPLTYAWTQTSGPSVTLNGSSTASPTFTAPALNNGADPVTLTFLLTVSNGVSALDVTPTTTVTVTAPPVAAPTGDAGATQTVSAAAVVTLTGSAQDHNTPLRPLTYAWTQTSGTHVDLNNAGLSSPSFTAPAPPNGETATLVFTLTISNGVPALDVIYTTTVVVNGPAIVAPEVTVGAAQTVASAAAVSLTGTAQDHNAPARPLTYAWSQTSGDPIVVLANANTLTPTFTAPSLDNGSQPATLTFQLKVSNGVPDLDAIATTSVVVESPAVVAPTANAGAPQTVAAAAAVTLTGSGQDHNTPVRPLTYAWVQTSGTPAVALTNANTATPTFAAPALNNGADPVTLTFQVTVSNGVAALDATATTTVTINAPPLLAPEASAGAPQTVASEAIVVLGGAAQDHNTPARPINFAWTQTQGPIVELQNVNTLTPSFTAPLLPPGSGSVALAFALTVSNGLAALDVVASTTVTVASSAPIQPPSASAGEVQIVTADAPVVLAGVAIDPNVPARPLALTWSQTSGPVVALSDANAISPTFVAPSIPAGDSPLTLGFSLRADNGVMASTAGTTVTVRPLVQKLAASQPVTADGAGTQTTPPFNAAAGDLLVAFATSDGPGTPKQTTTISGGGLTWTLERRVNAQGGTADVWWAMTPGALAGITVSSVQAVAGYYQSLTVMTFAGASGIGATAGATGTTGAASVSVSTKKAGSLVYAVGLDWDRAIARTVAPDQTLVREYLSPSNDTHWLQTVTAGAINVPGTTVQLKLTAPTTDRWNFAAVEIVPALLPPIANAGVMQVVPPDSLVGLTGFAVDSNTPARPLTITWTQTSGTPVTLVNSDAGVGSFIAPSLPAGVTTLPLGFTLTVSNGLLSATSTTTVLVRAAPVAGSLVGTPVVFSDGLGPRTTPLFSADAGDLLVAFVSSDGPGTPKQTATVAGGGLTWTLASRANGQPGTSEIWTAIAPAALTDLTVTATQSVASGPTNSAFQQSITIVKFAGASGIGAIATANAATGAPVVPLTATRAGSMVFGVGNDWDRAVPRTMTSDQAMVHEYLGPTDDAHWVQTLTAGPVLTAGATQLRDTGPTNDHWNFAAVEILSALVQPLANAGATQTVNPAVLVTLGGSASDPNLPPRPITIAWTQTSGPAVILAGADTATPTFTAPTLAPGVMTATLGFTMTVTSDLFASSSNTTVVVKAPSVPVSVGTTVFSDGLGKRTTAPLSAAAGDLLVAFVSSDGPSTPKQTATVAGGGLTWTLARRVNTQGGTAEIWTASTLSALTDITVTSTQGVASSGTAAAFYQSLTVVTFGGAAVGATAGANGPTGAPSVSVTTTKAGSWVFAVGNDYDRAIARTLAADQTMVHQFLGTMDDTHWVQMLTASPVGAAGVSVPIKDTAPTTDRWNFAAIEIISR